MLITNNIEDPHWILSYPKTTQFTASQVIVLQLISDTVLFFFSCFGLKKRPISIPFSNSNFTTRRGRAGSNSAPYSKVPGSHLGPGSG